VYRIFLKQNNIFSMNYYESEDLKKFGKIGEFQKPMADQFFKWYGEVFAEGTLSAREKSLIALAVSHAMQCPYCIDAYSTEAVEKGYTEAQMMEAVHVAAAIKGGAVLAHGVQMMNKVKEISM
jgi:alkylhydroperoxidase/carboxymuconolactone decarboxylase family protein